MGTRLPSLPRPGARESTTPAARWWRHGWLIDQRRSARWEPCAWLARPEARDLAARYRGRVVRLLRLPKGYGANERLDDGVIVPVDPEPFGVEAVVSVGWPGAPPIPEGAVLIGPVDFLLAAERRQGPPAADAGPSEASAPEPLSADLTPVARGEVDWFRIAVWAGGLAFSLLVWLALFVAIRALVG